MIENYAARHFTGVITADEETAKRFYSLNARVQPIRNYPQAQEFSAPKLRNPRRFYSGRVANFGGIVEDRCIRETVQAMNVVPGHISATMVLAGKIYAADLRSEIERFPGWSRVDYRGMMSRGEMLAALENVAAAIILFTRGPNNLEVRSNRLFEAMAAGLPVIVPDFPKWERVIEEGRCGIAVDPHDTRQIADAIVYLLTHPDQAHQMGSRGRELFERKYNWGVEENNLISFYAELGVSPPLSHTIQPIL